MRESNSLLVLLLVVGACRGEHAEAVAARESGKLVVFTDNYPLRYFAERIGGERVVAVFPAPPDVDPTRWRPDADTVRHYQSADIVLCNGAGHSKWLRTASLPAARLVDTSRGFYQEHIVVPDAIVHAHGPEAEHSHAARVPHVWLDPGLAILQARAVEAALARVRPDDAEVFATGLAALEKDLRDLEDRLAKTASDETLVSSAPLYPYLARRLGVDVRHAHLAPDRAPTAAEWQKLERLLAEHPAKRMLWPAHPLDETVARLEGLGVRCVVVDPCGNVPAQGDFLTVMRANVDALAP